MYCYKFCKLKTTNMETVTLCVVTFIGLYVRQSVNYTASAGRVLSYLPLGRFITHTQFILQNFLSLQNIDTLK
jgi:hypothetical protein